MNEALSSLCGLPIRSGAFAGLLAAVAATLPSVTCASPASVTFAQSAPAVDAYDFVEIALKVDHPHPDAANPFTDVAVTGTFGKAGQTEKIKVDGFCDSMAGDVYRIRFMPAAVQLAPGEYTGKWFCAFTGEIVPLPDVICGPSWTSPASPTNSGPMWEDANPLHRGALDWALLLSRKLP